MKWAYTSRQESHATNKAQRQMAPKEIDTGIETYFELREQEIPPYGYNPEEMEGAVIDWFKTGYIDPDYLKYLRAHQ